MYMTIVVSLSQFRRNIAEYIAKAREGNTIVLEDDKRSQLVAQLESVKQFRSDTFKKALLDAKGVFTSDNHPEWETMENVLKWVNQNRAASDRSF